MATEMTNTHFLFQHRLADINSRCKADFKDYFECMDYYR